MTCDNGLTTVLSKRFNVPPTTGDTTFAAGTIAYLYPSVPAAGNNGIAPPITAPSAPNFNFLLNNSAALSLPSKASISTDSVKPNKSDKGCCSLVETARSETPPIAPKYPALLTSSVPFDNPGFVKLVTCAPLRSFKPPPTLAATPNGNPN